MRKMQNNEGLGFLKKKISNSPLYNQQIFIFKYLNSLPEEVQKEIGFTIFNPERLKDMINVSLEENTISGFDTACELFFRCVSSLDEDELKELLQTDVIETFIDKTYRNKKYIEASYRWCFGYVANMDKRVKNRFMDSIVKKLPTLNNSTIEWIINEIISNEKTGKNNHGLYLSSLFLNKTIYDRCIYDPKVRKAIMKQNLKK